MARAHVPGQVGPTAFTVGIGSILAFGTNKLVENFNNLFVGIVLISFAYLVTVVSGTVNADYLGHEDWRAAFDNIGPVALVALVFHNERTRIFCLFEHTGPFWSCWRDP